MFLKPLCSETVLQFFGTKRKGDKNFSNKSNQSQYFYVVLVYKYKRIFGKASFYDPFQNTIKYFKTVGYNMDNM